jgi:hypothetical protein
MSAKMSPFDPQNDVIGESFDNPPKLGEKQASFQECQRMFGGECMELDWTPLGYRRHRA